MTDSEISKKMDDRTLYDIYTYEKQALDLIEQRFKDNKDHTNYKLLKTLLI